MTGVIYARYSEGPNQSEQSIEGQVADCMAFAEREGIRIVNIYADRHVSGKSIAGRSEFQRMLADAEKRQFDCVIVWKIDRFGRNRQDIAISKMRLNNAGVQLKYAVEAVPEGPEGVILEALLEGLAEYYSADLRQKVTRGIRESAKKGKVHGGFLPIGFARDPDRHLLLDEKAAAAVRDVFRLHIAGRPTDELVCALKRGTDKKVDKNTIYRMLRNPKYCGEWEIAGIDMNAPAIISKEMFMEAQRHFKTSRNNAASKAKTDYLLSGKCVCGYCGSGVICDCGTGSRVYHYYSCGGKKRGSGCELSPIRADKLEKTVIDAVLRDMLHDDVIDEIVQKVMEIQAEDQKDESLEAMKRSLAGMKKRQANLVRSIEYGGDVVMLTDRLKDLQKEINDLEADIASAEFSKPVHLTESLVRSWLQNFRLTNPDDPKTRKKLVDAFVKKIELRNGEALIFFNLSDPSKSSDSARILEKECLNPNISICYPYILLRVDLADASIKYKRGI